MNFNSETGAYVAVSSIDLLEECLDSIYRARKKSLDARGIRANIVLEKRRAKLQSQSRQRPGTDHSLRNEINHDASFADATAKLASRSTPSPIEISTEETLNEDTAYDKKAQQIFEEFEVELVSWWGQQPEKREDDDCKGEYADYLTEKYMCQKLDAFPPSSEVTSIRKRIYKIIEDFAADDKFKIEAHFKSAEYVGGKQQKGGVPRVNPKEKSSSVSMPHKGKDQAMPHKKSSSISPAERALAVAGAASLKSARKTADGAVDVVSTVEQKRVQEKDKIQEQYAAYMKMKQQTVEVESKEHLQQYEQLNDDIRGLLSSIQSNKPVK